LLTILDSLVLLWFLSAYRDGREREAVSGGIIGFFSQKCKIVKFFFEVDVSHNNARIFSETLFFDFKQGFSSQFKIKPVFLWVFSR